MREIPDGAPLSVTLTPATTADQQRLDAGLRTLLSEDPTLRVSADDPTGGVVVAGTGELHLEIILERLRREFNVVASVGRPTIAYRETFTCPADGEMKYATQTGDRGQYGHVKIHVTPGRRGSGLVFESEIRDGAIPDRFIAAVRDGIEEARMSGPLAGHPMDDIRVALYDGSYHDVDSSETAFRLAAAMAFQDAARKAMPVLLEPVMRVQVSVPADATHHVVENLRSRRGTVESSEDRHGTQVIDARVPLAEMFGYSCDLRERTRGRGSFDMRLECYQPCRRPEGTDHDRDSLVGAPLRPRPGRRASGIALPEPDLGGPGE